MNLNSEIVLNQALILLDEACFDFASQQPTSNVAKWRTPLKVNELKILSSSIIKGTKNLERFGPVLGVECGYMGARAGQHGRPEQPQLFKSL